jgi:hypothetical protein
MRALLLSVLLLLGCSDDADDLGIGGQCANPDQCADGQMCLPFKGGYCGLTDCASDLDCPPRSACIAHSDGTNYCFRTCGEKRDCNVNRDVANEANCSSSVVFVDGAKGRKACVPPTGS